jgi:hypothetical protein
LERDFRGGGRPLRSQRRAAQEREGMRREHRQNADLLPRHCRIVLENKGSNRSP